MTRRYVKHGCSGKNTTSEYMTWLAMLQRCGNPRCKAFKDYGGRGIDVCERWTNFVNFITDMGLRPSPDHSIDRIDNSKGYGPDNCKWSTKAEQNRNRRPNIIVTVNGERMILKDATTKLGLAYHTVARRLRNGWSEKDALTT